MEKANTREAEGSSEVTSKVVGWAQWQKLQEGRAPLGPGSQLGEGHRPMSPREQQVLVVEPLGKEHITAASGVDSAHWLLTTPGPCH